MTQVSIRQIQGDEMLEILYWLPSYAFQPSPPMPDKAERQEVLRQRQGVTYLAVFEDGDPVACVAGSRMTQNVRGVLFGMAGVWGVATHPSARRKGYSRRLMAALMGELRDQGLPLSGLYPFRESFYERLGYAAFPYQRKARFATTALGPLLKASLDGGVELFPMAEAYDDYLEYTRLIQRRLHGMALFDYPGPAVGPRTNYWLALARSGGELVGLMAYDLKGENVTEFHLKATRFYYHTSLGRYLLLEWIARHIDQAATAELWLPPSELPETWLADLQVRLEAFKLAPMGRVLDVTRLEGMPAGPGGFTARLSDPLCPWNEGAWRFEGCDGVLQVSPSELAECQLSIQGLSALVYGTHDPADFPLRGWGDPTSRVQEAMRAMFPPKIPYIHEFF